MRNWRAGSGSERLSNPTEFADVSFTLHKGEILVLWVGGGWALGTIQHCLV
jgi:hypothetical protein